MKKIKLKTLIESLVREEMSSSSLDRLMAAIEEMENDTEVVELLLRALRQEKMTDVLSRLNDYLADKTSSEDGEDGESMSSRDFGVGSALDRATGVRSPR